MPGLKYNSVLVNMHIKLDRWSNQWQWS